MRNTTQLSRPATKWAACICAMLALVSASVSADKTAPLSLTPVDISRFFASPDTTTVLSWSAPAVNAGATIGYQITDYRGADVMSGTATVSASGRVELTFKQPRGYYDVAFPTTGQSFGVAVLPAYAGKRDPFFCIDAGLSWLETRRPLREPLICIMERCGISTARERFSWGQIEPTPGAFDFQTSRHFDEIRQTYAAHHVRVLELLAGSPNWTAPVPPGMFPGNLVAASDSVKAIVDHWRPSIGAIEVWNEPNQGATVPADQYVPLAKAISRTLPAGPDQPLIGGGVFGEFNRAYVEQSNRNGLLADTDFLSFHDYADATFLEGEIAAYRGLVKEGGRESTPLWITECGWPWTSGPARPPKTEAAVSALQIAMKAVEAKACGVERFFPFVYTHYLEPPKSFGMMGKEVTPLRPMAAYAQAIRALSGKQYIGDIRLASPAVKRCRAFSDGAKAVVVVYTGHADSASIVQLPFPFTEAEGADGSALPASDSGSLPVLDGIAYVTINAKAINGSLIRNTAATRLLAASRNRQPAARLRSPIVLQGPIDATTTTPYASGCYVASNSVRQLAIPVSVTNLDQARRTASLSLTINGAPVGGRKSVDVDAAGTATARWDIDLSRTFDKAENAVVNVSGADDTGARISPLSRTFTVQRELSDYLTRYPGSQRIAIADPAKWRKNISANGSMDVTLSTDKNWLLTATFGAGSSWVYPIFSLPKMIHLARADGILVRAKLTGTGHAYFLLAEANKSIYNISDFLPADGQWHTRYLRFDAFSALAAGPPDPDGKLDRDQIGGLQIGTSNSDGTMTLEVSDLLAIVDGK